jgi:hypothetical protein
LGAENAAQLSIEDSEIDFLTTSGVVRIGALATFTNGSVTAPINTGNINLAGAITAPGTFNTLSLITQGAIVDATAGEQVDLTVTNLALQAGAGIGASGTGNLNITADVLAAHNDLPVTASAGGIFVNNVSNLTIGIVDGVVGVLNNFATGAIEIDVDASTSPVEAGDLAVDQAISSVNGAITITADASITFAAIGDVTSTGGNISITADTATGDNDGSITMADGAIINASAGTVTMVADGDVTLGSVQSSSTSASAISITPTSGAVLDGGDIDDDLIANLGGVVITSDKGVGAVGDALETTVGSLDITNASGVINIVETDALSIVKIEQTGTDAADTVTVVTTNGSITVASSGSVVIAEAGNIVLTAGGATSDINVNNVVEVIARQQRENDELKACKIGANFRRSWAAPSEEANDAAFHRK